MRLFLTRDSWVSFAAFAGLPSGVGKVDVANREARADPESIGSQTSLGGRQVRAPGGCPGLVLLSAVLCRAQEHAPDAPPLTRAPALQGDWLTLLGVSR